MFTIQYEAVDGSHKTQTLESSNRQKLVQHLASFTRPIAAVYEQTTSVTKRTRKELADWPGAKSQYATDFINSPL